MLRGRIANIDDIIGLQYRIQIGSVGVTVNSFGI